MLTCRNAYQVRFSFTATPRERARGYPRHASACRSYGGSPMVVHSRVSMPDHITWWEPYRESVRGQLVAFRGALCRGRLWRWVLVASLIINVAVGIIFAMSGGPGSFVWWHHLVLQILITFTILLQMLARILTVPRRIVLYHGGLNIWQGGRSDRFLRDRILWMSVRETPNRCARLVVTAIVNKHSGPRTFDLIIGRTTDLQAVRQLAATFYSPNGW